MGLILPSLTLFVHIPDTILCHILTHLVVPAIHQVQLPCLWVVEEAILVTVVRLGVVRVVCENCGGKTFIQVDARISIGLHSEGIAPEQVE